MKCRHLLLCLLILCCSLVGKAQKLTGTVRDAANKEALIGVVITQKGTSNAVRTDFNGKFEINLSNSGPKDSLSITFLGYSSTTIAITNKTYYNITMSEGSVVTKEAVISGSRINEKLQESPITVERMSVAAIKETPAIGFYEGLSNLKGVDMTSASLGFKIINTRGFNSTSPVRTLQIIDGMDNQAPGLNFSLGNFVGASEIDIESVDLIVGANSAVYGPNAFNGVISMTTKDPFKFPGLTVQVKGASQDLFEGAVRYAKVYKKKFAFKLNAYYLNATDFLADNYQPTGTSQNKIETPFGLDAVNVYGDEILYDPKTRGTFRDLPAGDTNKYFYYRSGYRETDLINRNTNSLKLNGGLYYKFGKNTTASYTYNMGTGSTVYQGDNRYAIKNILFQQHKFEVKGDRFFARAYTTLEDAGDSYDIVFTAFKLLESGKTRTKWKTDFLDAYTQSYRDQYGSGYFNTDSAFTEAKLQEFYARLQQARDSANNKYYDPKSDEFKAAFNKITTTASFLPKAPGEVGGTKFQDKSSLSHFEAQYNFDLSKIAKFLPSKFVVGNAYRTYNPRSYGTIFSDTVDSRVNIITHSKDSSGNDIYDTTANPDYNTFKEINVWEYGVYLNTEKRFFRDHLNIIFATRMDFHKNFNPNVSPAISAVYTFKKFNNIRVTYSTAIRNPTLQDQYLYYNIGRAILRGNIDGFGGDQYVLLNDYIYKYLKGSPVSAYNVEKVRPERVRTFEIGYKGIISQKFYIDGSYYRSVYTDFLGNVLLYSNPVPPPGVAVGDQVVRVAANSISTVTAQGFSIGVNYYFRKNYSITTNYTFAPPVKKSNPDDPIIPGFNTPKNKYNVSFAARNIRNKYGFNMTYKWVQGFEFTGSPQFTGSIPSYGLLDTQVNYKITAYNATVKLGASNVLNNKHFEAYGAPRIGMLAYASVNIEFN